MDPIFVEALDGFAASFERARASGQRNFNAGSLATVDPSGQPAARAVLLKGFDAHGFVVFTDSRSRKARDLRAEPRAALCFYWEPLEEQARVEGRAEPVSPDQVAADFAARPRAGQLMIWAARQSAPVASRDQLVTSLRELGARHPGDGSLPVPAHWCGYRIRAHRIELWRGRRDRMHERLEYTAEPGGWRRTLLAP